MNTVLKALLETGRVVGKDGQYLELHSNIGTEVGSMIQEWIRASACVNAVEVGLAFGVSGLFILDELSKTPGAKLHGIDPMQFNERWHGLGLENIKRSGLENLYQFYHEPSYSALPKILAQGNRIQFGLIDGWHTFDYALVDFFYIDKMLDVNGVIVFDDVGYKAIRKAVTFVLSNLDYELVDGIRFSDRVKKDIKKSIKSMAVFLSRDDWTPSPESRRHFESLENMHTVVIRKKSEDNRSFRHFLPF